MTGSIRQVIPEQWDSMQNKRNELSSHKVYAGNLNAHRRVKKDSLSKKVMNCVITVKWYFGKGKTMGTMNRLSFTRVWGGEIWINRVQKPFGAVKALYMKLQWYQRCQEPGGGGGEAHRWNTRDAYGGESVLCGTVRMDAWGYVFVKSREIYAYSFDQAYQRLCIY